MILFLFLVKKMRKINRNYCNCNELNLLKINKKEYLNKKSSSILTYYASLFCVLGSLFFVFLGIDYFVYERQQQHQYNIINFVWADDINGTENTDNITGTINQDIIRGFGGNDTLAGKEAGDDISGGSGDDLIYGNEGRDILKGKAGNDHLEGAEGNDRIYGDRGNDMLIGGPGDDTLTGGLGKDIFICGDATDTITDFNITQKDTIPSNDCENIKYGSNGNNTENTTSSIEEEKKPDSGGFFGLFKWIGNQEYTLI